ncbi:hypothetical protein KIN20_010831 [Parelaphostrongylus tenuis]|uniref:Uncharacterized protein n=1 Tax=Parelaphostrongylus tenuis TaxID=148309 RepID=A0AAD5MU35_PARTN|nr:hypothetical protein KIN20_010831 [Parelaphostrongylus tenuis]
MTEFIELAASIWGSAVDDVKTTTKVTVIAILVTVMDCSKNFTKLFAQRNMCDAHAGRHRDICCSLLTRINAAVMETKPAKR